MQSSPAIIVHSPSFNNYSSGKLAEIAARVVEEFRGENEDDDDIFNFNNEEKEEFSTDQLKTQEKVKDNEEDDEEFEFAVECREPYSSPISADEIFYNGQIRPVYPLFDTSLLLGHDNSHSNTVSSIKPPVRLSLRKLFIEERDSASCSSSEADELDGISPGTYCVWTPKTETCKKSNSTGNSSKRWKFRDLLHRSNSDGGAGKDTFVFFTPPIAKKRNDQKVEKNKTDTGDGEGVPHKQMNKPMKESDLRRSFLPYRKDLVGVFTNVNGLSRNLHPF